MFLPRLCLTSMALAVALPATTALADLQLSAAFADEARLLLESGDRLGAIEAALKGLPDAPTEADMETYAAAHDMLFRATAARVVRQDRAGPQFFAVNATGDRAVLGGSIPRSEVAPPPLDRSVTLEDLRARMEAGAAAVATIDPYVLIDPRDGAPVAELVPAKTLLSDDLVWSPSQAPAFSPDGTVVALWAMDAREALVFASFDGAPVATLSPPGAGVPGAVVGFSHDGTRLATVSERRVAVWEVETWQLLETHDLTAFDGPTALAWSAAGDLVAAVGRRASEYVWGPFTIHRLGPEGPVALVEEIPGRTEGWLGLLASPFGPLIMLEADETAAVVDLSTGAVTDMPEPMGALFLRGGTVMGVRSQRFDPQTFMPMPGHEIMVGTFEGELLDPVLRDWPPLEQFVTDLSGNPLDSIGPPRPFAYRGDDVPTGRALYDMVWAGLADEVRAAVAAERIPRP